MKTNLIKYCNVCGGKLEFALLDGKKRLICGDCNTITYLNSKPCVGAFVIEDNNILLTRRKYNPYKNYWDIPGGFLESNEHPEKGLVRELKEELGITITIKKFFGIFIDKYGKDGFSTLNIFYICKKRTEPQR